LVPDFIEEGRLFVKELPRKISGHKGEEGRK
jgi:hypothetical protein